jgi:hypothetical protein
MSRTKFLNELDDYLEKKNDDKKHETIEELFTEVGRIWIRDKRFKELISFIHDEYDTGQFTPFISEVENALLQQNLLQEFKVLWKGILRMRIERLWDWKKYFEENKISRNRLLEQQEFALKGIDRFLHGLAKFNDKEEINKTELIRLSVKNLDRPKPAPTTDKRKIDETLFWELINFSREATNNRFDFKESLKNKLSAFRPDEIRKFHKIFLTKFYELNTWENWALAYVYRRGCGDDEFDYFKAWVI